jgi:hypothetical protein
LSCGWLLLGCCGWLRGDHPLSGRHEASMLIDVTDDFDVVVDVIVVVVGRGCCGGVVALWRLRCCGWVGGCWRWRCCVLRLSLALALALALCVDVEEGVVHWDGGLDCCWW